MMILGLDENLKSLDGTVDLKQQDPDQEDVPVKDRKTTIFTHKLVIVNSLLAPKEGSKGAENMDKFFLAKRIQDSNGSVEVSETELEQIKDCVNTTFPSPLIVGQVYGKLKGAK